MVLRKKEVYSIITPIPGFIPRQLALDILHSHSEVITLNPLVLEHKAIPPPRTAPSDEFYSTWYEITERIQYVPGLGKMGSGLISFNGCFHDMPWGLQTHIYAPAGLDIRYKYRIGGNQPGVEPPEPQEMGLAALGAPRDGLYLREDIEFKCNFAMVSFVKSLNKAASKAMVERIIKKAELLDAGVLKAMIENGRIRTINPNDRSNTEAMRVPPSPRPTPPMSPSSIYHQQPQSPSIPYQVPRPPSSQPPTYATSEGGGSRPPTSHADGKNAHYYQPPSHHAVEAPAHEMGPPQTQNAIVMELPGDFTYNVSPNLPPQPSPSMQSEQNRASVASSSSLNPNTNTWPWSATSSQPSPGHPPSTRPTSYGSNDTDGARFHSPSLDGKFSRASELATHTETREEHGSGNGRSGRWSWGAQKDTAMPKPLAPRAQRSSSGASYGARS